MKTIMLPNPLHINPGDTAYIAYTTATGRHINKQFHSFDKPRIFDRVIVEECNKDDLSRFNISDGFIMVLGKG